MEAPAAKCYWVEFDGPMVTHKERSRYPGAAKARHIRAFRDACIVSFSLHFLAWGLGAWPVKMSGAETAFSLGWILNYLFSFAGRRPIECERDLDLLPGTSDEGESRKRELTG